MTNLTDLGTQFFREQEKLGGAISPELVAPGYTATINGNPPMDRAGHDGFGRAFRAGFPDMHHEIELAFASGEHVFVRFVLHGTHEGAFFGIPPTKKRISVPAHVVMDVHDGRVTRLKGVFDEAGMLRQLGVIP